MNIRFSAIAVIKQLRLGPEYFSLESYFYFLWPILNIERNNKIILDKFYN